MNVKKAIKRIVALGTGAALMGATVLGAMAADLSDFPAPFVEDGQFNAMIVVGESAATADVIGAVDIATTLQYEMKEAASAGAGSGSSVTVSGDSFELRLSNDALQLGETLGSVITAVEDEDLGALRGGEFEDEDYEESLVLADGMVDFVEPSDGDYEDEPDFYLKFAEGDLIYQYAMEFTTAPSADNESNVFDDFEDKTLRIMGTAYTVSEMKASASGVKLTLLGGDSNDVIEEYATKTYNVNGKEYEVEATYIDTKAKFKVNGEVTDALAEGETYELADGTEIGVREVLENEAGEGGQDIVEFYLGANKVVIESDPTDTTDWNDLEVGDETYNNVEAQIVGTFSGVDSFAFEGINVNVTAADEYWLAAGDMLSEYIDGSDDDYLFGGVDFLFGGMTEPASSDVVLKADSAYQYSLEFETVGGLDYSLPLFYADDVNAIGDDDGTLNLSTSGFLYDNNMFILGTSETDVEDREARIYRYTDYDWDDKEVTIKDLAGDSMTISLDGSGAKSQRIDGVYHNFQLYDDGNLTVSGRTDSFGLKSGAWISFEDNFGAGTNWVTVNITVPADMTEDGTTAEKFLFDVNHTMAQSPTEIRVSSVTATPSALTLVEVKDDVTVDYSKYGVRVERDASGDEVDVTFDIPHSQRLPQVFAVSGEVSSSTVEGMSGSAYSIAPVKSGIAMLDTEVGSSWRNGNSIVVGGPCVNSVAAELMGNPAECTEGFTSGSAMVKLFEQSGNNVAMLVAGYSADDSRRAATAVHKFRSYSGFKGMEVKVSGTSMSDISVTSVQ